MLRHFRKSSRHFFIFTAPHCDTLLSYARNVTIQCFSNLGTSKSTYFNIIPSSNIPFGLVLMVLAGSDGHTTSTLINSDQCNIQYLATSWVSLIGNSHSFSYRISEHIIIYDHELSFIDIHSITYITYNIIIIYHHISYIIYHITHNIQYQTGYNISSFSHHFLLIFSWVICEAWRAPPWAPSWADSVGCGALATGRFASQGTLRCKAQGAGPKRGAHMER